MIFPVRFENLEKQPWKSLARQKQKYQTDNHKDVKTKNIEIYKQTAIKKLDRQSWKY